MGGRAFEDLVVWRRAHSLAIAVYRATQPFPLAERFGITAQIRRAAVSVPTNIAEGCKRISQRDFAHFLNMAEGSAAETRYLVRLCKDLGYLGIEAAQALDTEALQVERMLCTLRRVVSGNRTPKTVSSPPADSGYRL